MMTDRRRFLGALGAWALVPALTRPAGSSVQDPAQDETGALRDPASAGRSRERVTDKDNDGFIMAVEKRLQCTCGCTLDIYTCRTTDFTCTYSPELHKEVVALHDGGMTADQIVAAFVDKYGEKVLMAPKPEGFNYAGYLVPGALLVLVGGGLFAVLRRRAIVQAAAPVAAPGTAGGPVAPSTEELARLEQALRESEQ